MPRNSTGFVKAELFSSTVGLARCHAALTASCNFLVLLSCVVVLLYECAQVLSFLRSLPVQPTSFQSVFHSIYPRFALGLVWEARWLEPTKLRGTCFTISLELVSGVNVEFAKRDDGLLSMRSFAMGCCGKMVLASCHRHVSVCQRRPDHERTQRGVHAVFWIFACICLLVSMALVDLQPPPRHLWWPLFSERWHLIFAKRLRCTPVLPATSTTTVIAAKADSFLVTSPGALLVWEGFDMSHVKTPQAVAGDHEPLLAAASQSWDRRIFGPASFLPPGQEIPTLDSSTQLIALPRQVKFPCPRDFCSCLSQSIAISQRWFEGLAGHCQRFVYCSHVDK